MSTKTFWKIVSAVELLLAIAVILLDLFIPTLVILAHGFSNTIGLIAFYFVGPIYGFW